MMTRTQAWVFKISMQDRFSVLLLAKNKRLVLAGNENVMTNDPERTKIYAQFYEVVSVYLNTRYSEITRITRRP